MITHLICSITTLPVVVKHEWIRKESKKAILLIYHKNNNNSYSSRVQCIYLVVYISDNNRV